jgi:hypothetical protein
MDVVLFARTPAHIASEINLIKSWTDKIMLQNYSESVKHDEQMDPEKTNIMRFFKGPAICIAFVCTMTYDSIKKNGGGLHGKIIKSLCAH